MRAIGWGTADVAAVAGIEPRGSAAREIDTLWWLLFVLGAVALVLVGAALAAGLARRRDDGSGGPATRREQPDAQESERAARPWLVAGGVVLPLVTIAIVLVATIDSMRSLEARADADALTIDVIGHQWWWEVRYPDAGVVTANEIHIPAATPVRLRLHSADVVHSFWVPELAGKLDLIPERVNELVIDADRPGEYLGRCAEFCGLQHANMPVLVVAHDDAGFRSWLQEQADAAPEPDGAAAEGLTAFLDGGCAACHTISGTSADGERGPDLTHVASRAFIAGGLLEPVGPDLRTWITDPHAVKPGVLMPDPELTPAEIDRIVAYLETLR